MFVARELRRSHDHDVGPLTSVFILRALDTHTNRSTKPISVSLNAHCTAVCVCAVLRSVFSSVGVKRVPERLDKIADPSTLLSSDSYYCQKCRYSPIFQLQDRYYKFVWFSFSCSSVLLFIHPGEFYPDERFGGFVVVFVTDATAEYSNLSKYQRHELCRAGQSEGVGPPKLLGRTSPSFKCIC